MASFLTSGSLSQTVDDHIAWFADWHRLAFVDLSPRGEQAKKLPPPLSFPLWYKSALTTLPQDQPAIDRLAVLHDQLHTLARLVLMNTPDGQPVAAKDYEAVVAKYQELIQGLRRLERAFAVAASGLDLLTGLRSRVGLAEDLAREHSRFARTGKPFCIAILDIDHFKQINDAHGHDAGDRVLAAVADHVSRSLRPFDDAYRMGGEEFLLCLKEADLATGLKVLERLRASLAELPIMLADKPAPPLRSDELRGVEDKSPEAAEQRRVIKVTASCGLTVSAQEIAIEDMLHTADQALYRAKNSGRNQIVVMEAEV